MVAEEWQGKGIGTRIIQQTICLAQAAGVTELRMKARERTMASMLRKAAFLRWWGVTLTEEGEPKEIGDEIIQPLQLHLPEKMPFS